MPREAAGGIRRKRTFSTLSRYTLFPVKCDKYLNSSCRGKRSLFVSYWKLQNKVESIASYCALPSTHLQSSVAFGRPCKPSVFATRGSVENRGSPSLGNARQTVVVHIRDRLSFREIDKAQRQAGRLLARDKVRGGKRSEVRNVSFSSVLHHAWSKRRRLRSRAESKSYSQCQRPGGVGRRGRRPCRGAPGLFRPKSGTPTTSLRARGS